MMVIAAVVVNLISRMTWFLTTILTLLVRIIKPTPLKISETIEDERNL